MSTHRSFARRLRSARGQALIETALTLPIVLVLSISIFEFGRALQVWQLLTNAAREGARVAVLPGTSPAEVEARTVQYLNAGGLGREGLNLSDTVTVVADTIDMGTGPVNASRVTVAYPYQFMVLNPIMQLIAPGSDVGAPITMTASALMRNESAF